MCTKGITRSISSYWHNGQIRPYQWCDMFNTCVESSKENLKPSMRIAHFFISFYPIRLMRQARRCHRILIVINQILIHWFLYKQMVSSILDSFLSLSSSSFCLYRLVNLSEKKDSRLVNRQKKSDNKITNTHWISPLLMRIVGDGKKRLS